MRQFSLILFTAAVLSLGTTACDAPPTSPSTGDPYTIERVNAVGEPVALANFSGRYLWVDYAAEWCAACVPQTHAIKSVASRSSSIVVYVTVMTSEPGGYGHPATQETAARWAERFDLDPRHVIAADLTSMTLPRHILFSPTGEKLFDHTGPLTAAEISTIIDGKTN